MNRLGARWRGPPVAAALALGVPLALVWWAFPEALPWWRSVAIVSGWAGTGLLLASLVLMVREPRIAGLMGGLETAYRWHHRSGMAAYLLLLVHPLALAADGQAESPARAWQILAPWAQSWPVWLGWAALVLLMIGLAATFALHLPYRRWRGLHLVLAAGGPGGLTHVVGRRAPPGPGFALVALAVLALGARFLVGDLGVAARPYRVTAVAQRGAGVIEASLAPCAAALAVAPGQFVLAAFDEGPRYRGCGEYHPFTVSGVDRDAQLRVAVKALGPCSQRLQTLESGVLVRLQGPFGRFLDAPAAGPRLWIAGGIGITPFMAALRAGPLEAPTILIYVHREAADAPFADELAALAAGDRRFALITCATGEGAPDFDALLARVDRLAERTVHVCGPPAMFDALVAHLRECGVAPGDIHYERFDFR